MNSAHIELEDLGRIDHRAERGLYSWTDALVICSSTSFDCVFSSTPPWPQALSCKILMMNHYQNF
jgi:hypothetical protein